MARRASIKQYLSNPPIITPLGSRQPLKLYVSASKTTIGSMLAQEEENGNERVVYYLSRIVHNVEIRYTSIEKLCLVLYFSCLQLKYYLITSEVYVISQTDVIKYMLSSPMLHGHVGKWMLALIEFSHQYVLSKAIKGQVLVDFVVDHPCVDIKENPTGHLENFVELNPWRLFFDDSSHKKRCWCRHPDCVTK